MTRLNTYRRVIVGGLVTSIWGLLYAYTLLSLEAGSTSLVWLDSVLSACLLAVLCLFVAVGVRYVRFDSQKRYIPFVLLLLVLLLVWLAVVNLSLQVVFQSGTYFTRTLPLRLFVALPTSLLFFGWLMSQKETDCREEELPEPVMPIVAQPEEQLERITVKRGNAIEVLTLDEILYFQADGDYVTIQSTKGRFLKEQTMKYFESHLDNTLFVRCHRSYLVYVKAIERIELIEKQQQWLFLTNGERLRTSPMGYKLLKQRLGL